ncbi:hypothetical protein BGZ46_010717 [Entomortierella lignicola]|nr:hypothetical protein BGZ46_010717 [Entomortierella lignicola]
MPNWPKSKSGENPAKVKAPKPPKSQVAITMPKRKKELGTDTFGAGSGGDVVTPPTENPPQIPSFALPKITDYVTQKDGDTSKKTIIKEDGQSTNQFLDNQNQYNSSFICQDQSLTPLRTPGTPSSSGLMTPRSTRTSYFPATPATPASENTTATNSTNNSIRTTYTSAFGSRSDHQEKIISNGLKNNEQQRQNPPTTTTTTPCTPAVPETARPQYTRTEMPPTINTRPIVATQRPFHNPKSQTPSSSRTPAILPQNNSSATASTTTSGGGRVPRSYPTPDSLVTTTPKASHPMSEWRMMQMQLQQQDDLHHPLTLPSVSSIALSIPTTKLMSPPLTFGQLSISGSGATSAAASSACLCCSHTTNPSTCINAAPTTGTITGMSLAHSPAASETPTFGCLTPGADSVTQRHSFLLHPNASCSTFTASATMATHGSSPNSRQSWIRNATNLSPEGHSLYIHNNISTGSSDYFSSREVHSREMARGHGLGLGQGTLAGSTVTLQSGYPSSSADPSEFDQPTNSNSNNYGPDSTGLESPQNQIRNRSFLLSAPAFAVGGHGAKHCKNCPRNVSRKSSMSTIAAGTPTSPIPEPVVADNANMDASGMSTSLNVSNNSNSIHRSSSSSPGTLKTLSSKLAATTIRKLSITQRSLFSISKEDLSVDGYQCCLENASRETFSESEANESRSGASNCACCLHHDTKGNHGNKSGSVYGEGDPSSSDNKLQRVQSRLGRLRSKRGRKDKSRKSARRSYEMEYNFSSQFVRQEFAQYNYERQIEDFQRAARVFKEQKALTTAAAAASIAAEARAAIVEAAAAAAAATEAIKSKEQQNQQSSEKPSTSSTSTNITPMQKKEDVKRPQTKHSTDSIDGESTDLNGFKKSIATSNRPGVFRSVSRSQRRVGTSSNVAAKGAVTALASRRSYGNNLGSSYCSRGGNINHNGKTASTYLELGLVGMEMGSDLKLSGLGIEGVSGSDATNFDPCTEGATFDGHDRNISISHDVSNLDVKTATVSQYKQDLEAGVFDEMPRNDMMPPSPLSIRFPRRPDDVYSIQGRPSNVSQDSRMRHFKTTSNPKTVRSLHSVCSVDTVSQQISARHNQHRRIATGSIVASLHSQSQAAMSPTCETTGDGNIGGGGTPGTGAVLENSPIQVVRATVGTIDDSSLPCFTFRMWILSTIFIIMGAAISEYNFFRSNSAFFSIYFVQLASYFCGKGMAKCLPTREFEIHIPGLGWVADQWSKVTSSSSYKSVDEHEIGDIYGNSALSGNGRRVGGHSTSGPIHETGRTSISWKFTLNPGKFNMKEHMLIGIAAAAGSSPAYASNVIAIQSLVFNSPLGSLTGIGLVISSQFIGFSMWAQCNFFVGLIVMLWLITPIVYFSNYWSAMSYPIVSSNLYDNTSQLYDVAKILNKNLSFNVTMYDSYSPVIMTPYFAITYGTSFMAVIATFVHVALFYGSDIWLIAKTRCNRKIDLAKSSPFYQSIEKFFTSQSNSTAEQENIAVMSATEMTNIGSSIEHDYLIGSPRRRKSESMSSSRIGFMDGNFGTGNISGSGSDQRRSFQRSSHNAPSPQAPTSPQQGNAKPAVDYRDQIPTEMFGIEDIHTSLMRTYPEIPGSWFGTMFVICFAMAVFVCTTTDIHLPVYALVLALLLAVVFAIPMAIIQALSSSQIGLNVLSEVVCGYLLPGNQLGNSVFKCYSYMALYQCLNLTQGFKLGHYMKVPPRHIFIAVIYGTLLGAFVNLQVLEWVLLYNRQALFDADPSSGWSFRNLDLFFSASLLWGAISPTRLLSGESIYHFLPYCFILGAIVPLPCYIIYRYYPPYGAMCKGNSPFPFMPKCNCPASHIAASSEGVANATPAFPKTRRNNFHDMNQPDSLDNVLEEGRVRPSNLLSQYWPFNKSGKRQQKKTLYDKSIDLGSLPEPSSNNANNRDTQKESGSSVFTPHIYYGNPDSVWDHRLRSFPWHLVNTPLIFMGASFVPQAPASFVVSAGIVAFIFAFLVLRYRHEWWRRYTFVLAAALDAGTQICNMAIFVVFSLILKGSINFPSWIGNDANNPEKCGVGNGYD